MIALETYGSVLRRQRWVTLLVLAITIGSTVFFTIRQTPVYSASTMVAVTPNSRAQGTSEIIRSLDTLDRRTVIATMARIPPTREAREAAAARLQLSPGDLRGYSVRAAVLPNTNIIKIDVEGPEPQRAAELANAIAQITHQESRRMYRIYKMQTLSAAVAGRHPIYPSPQRNYMAGTILGLFLGVGAAFVTDYLRTAERGSA
ncbi:MAG: YveK family protein [Acidobacteriota bacterium]